MLQVGINYIIIKYYYEILLLLNIFFLDCNVTIKGYQGAIEMAHQENLRTDKCEWTIVAPKGSKVNITFTSLKLLHKRPPYLSFTMKSLAANSRRNNSQLTVSMVLHL